MPTYSGSLQAEKHLYNSSSVLKTTVTVSVRGSGVEPAVLPWIN